MRNSPEVHPAPDSRPRWFLPAQCLYRQLEDPLVFALVWLLLLMLPLSF